jgi:hypothetical protein
LTRLLKNLIKRIFSVSANLVRRHPSSERQALLLGQIAARQVGRIENVDTLADVEFGVFSQWGEDGIIEWLLSKSEDVPETFIEFGVEDYRESNTRFLLQHRNWRGLVIDGSAEHVANIRADDLSWRHELRAVCSFITSDNIEKIIADAGFAGEIGILSIDIDGNDYWVWQAINNISPHFVIIEYNSNLGDVQPLTIPYREDFFRTAADPANLYYGASCKAIEHLASLKGYVMLGSNRTGSNLFFVRSDRAFGFTSRVADTSPRASKVREARDISGQLTLLGGIARTELIAECPVVNVKTGKTGSLGSFGSLFSERWLDSLGVLKCEKD